MLYQVQVYGNGEAASYEVFGSTVAFEFASRLEERGLAVKVVPIPLVYVRDIRV